MLFPTSERAEAIDQLHAATCIYTASHIVDSLLNRVDWPRGSRRLCDPSCGDGMFLGRALVRLLSTRPGLKSAELADLLHGWELHPAAAAEARSRLAEILFEHGWPAAAATAAAAGVVRNQDFLTDAPADVCYHVIVGNPPYIRFPGVPEILQRDYLSVVPKHARADLLHSFLDRCVRALATDGEIALVTADRWIINSSAAELRSEMGARVSVHHLERLDPSSSFYRPKRLRRKGAPPRVHPIAVVLRPIGAGSLPLGRQPLYPDACSSPDAPPGAPKLADVATIRLAPWLGGPGIFVVDAETASRLPVDHLTPAIDTDDIVAGQLRPPKRYAIRTTREHEPPPAIMAHLDRNLPRLAERGRRSPRWLPPETWTGWDLDQPSLLVPRIARDLTPVRVPAGVLPIQHNLSIVSAGKWPLDKIEAALASPKANAWIKARAPRLENEFYSVTTTLLRQLPIFD